VIAQWSNYIPMSFIHVGLIQGTTCGSEFTSQLQGAATRNAPSVIGIKPQAVTLIHQEHREF